MPAATLWRYCPCGVWTFWRNGACSALGGYRVLRLFAGMPQHTKLYFQHYQPPSQGILQATQKQTFLFMKHLLTLTAMLMACAGAGAQSVAPIVSQEGFCSGYTPAEFTLDKR